MPNFDIFPSQLILKRTNNIYYWRMFANRKVSVCDMALLFGDTANIFFQMRPYLICDRTSKQRWNAISNSLMSSQLTCPEIEPIRKT
ncbi:hypothetical protein VB733_25665, partial [Calothrix sp. UHCC 0171]